jgi:5-formyltetrahydrofolate cyclo-ligase
MNEKLVAEVKQQLRLKIKSQRKLRAYDPEVAGKFNMQLAELCLLRGAKRIACYLPFDDEPDTELFIDWAIENEIEVLLPVAKPDGNLDWVVFDGTTSPGLFGFPEAVGSHEKPHLVDLAFIPALAIDRVGHRLGKGKGFYDRGLLDFEPLPPVIAIIYEDELIESIPSESHDQPVDAAMTPSGIIRFSERLN